MVISIRPAHVDEAEQIAGFHARVWLDTYHDIAPAAAIEKLDTKHRLPAWQTYLGMPKLRQHTLVAVRDGTIVGFVSFGPPTHSAFGARGEVKHLYVDQASKRQGIGRRLMFAAFQQIAVDEFEGAALAVVQGNTKALEFYEAMGGVEIGSFVDAGPIWRSDNLIIAWEAHPAF